MDIGRGIESDLDQFLQATKPLTEAGKLGCVLVQLPPFLRFNAERLESFLSLLPKQPRFAVGFRHRSWLREETFKLLEKYEVAYTIVDEPLLPPDVHVISSLAYIRWHGHGTKPWFNYRYSEEQLTEWLPRVRETAEKAKRVLGYFNNHFHGYAPENCLQIMQMLGIITQYGNAALRRVTVYRKGGSAKVGLEAWIEPIIDRTVERMLLDFADAEVIEAAGSIPDQDLSLREDSKRAVAAYVADTTVDINLEQRTITHHCPT